MIVHHAFADTPAAWPTAPTVSFLDFALVLVIIPVVIGLVLALFAMLPYIAKRRGSEPGAALETTHRS